MQSVLLALSTPRTFARLARPHKALVLGNRSTRSYTKMSSNTHVLTYFDIPGRALMTRVCFGAAGVPYENKLLTFAEFGALRGPTGSSEAAPTGALPLLTLPNGTLVTQSGAHARYAAKKAGMYPRDDDEAALFIDEVIGLTEDLMGKMPQDPDAEVKKTKREAFVKDGMPKFMNLLESKLKKSGGPFFAGGKLMLDDLALYSVTSGIASGMWDYVPPSVLDTWPLIKAHGEAVRAHPLVVQHGCLKA